MNWSRLYLAKETFSTTAFKKVEWSATFQDVTGASFSGPFPTGGKAGKIGTGRCELESQGAFAPEARGEMRLVLPGLDLWGDYANDRFAFGGGESTLRVRLDEPQIAVEGRTEITIERPKGRAANLFLGATKGDQFLGYIPACLKPGGALAFLFGSSALLPWFIPCAEPWGGQKLVEAPKPPPEMGKALADEGAWRRLEDVAGKLMEPLLAARVLFTCLQFVRYG